MRIAICTGTAALAIVALSVDRGVAQPSRAALTTGTFAIANVTVITMRDRAPIPNATVVVTDGRITAVGPARSTPVPAGARRIDGTGRFLIPGLADVHTHLYSDGTVADSLAPVELGVMVANGITTARLMIGHPEHLALRREIEAGRVLGPQLWVASPQLSGQPHPDGLLASTPAEARVAVLTAAKDGYDFIKITTDITPDVFDAIVTEARRQRIRVVGHVDPSVGIAKALAAGQQIEHLDDYFEASLADSAPSRESISNFAVFKLANWPSLDHLDDRKIAALGGATARAGVWSTPTLTIFNAAFAENPSEAEIMARPEWRMTPLETRTLYLKARAKYWEEAALKYRTPARRERFVDARRKMTRAIADSGGKIMAGSDAPEWLFGYGFTLHRELENLVLAGLTPYQALEAATTNPAEFFGATSEWGTIAVGKRADLVLLGADPLADIRNTNRIDAVAIGGKWLDRKTLDAMITAAESALGR